MYNTHGVAVVFQQCSMIVKRGKKFAHEHCKNKYHISNTVLIQKNTKDSIQSFKHLFSVLLSTFPTLKKYVK